MCKYYVGISHYNNYWVKILGFPEVGQKQKTEKKERQKRKTESQ